MTEENKDAGAPEKEAPVAKIVSEKPREVTIDLDWPVEFDGKRYETVTIRRCSAKEVSDYVESLSQPGHNRMPPNIDIPSAVYDALDDDDLYKIEQSARDFFPRRLLALMELAQDGPSTSSPS